MKAIRIATLGLGLVIGSATVASAQQQQGAPGRGNRPNALMVGIDSTLSAEQKTKLDDIQKKYAPDMTAARETMQADREGAMKKMMEIRTKQNVDVRAILTPAQQAIFDKNVEEQAKRMAAPRPAPSV